MIRVVLADDHHIVRQGLRALLEREKDMALIGEAADGLQAVDLAESLEPDVLVVDLMMPGLNGLEAARQIRARAPHTRIVILSMYDDPGYVQQALAAGVLGYVLKDSVAEELVDAIRRAVSGERYLSARASEGVEHAFHDGIAGSPKARYESLTPRERQVMHLAVEGLSSKEIAERLSISPRTVETHRAHILRKLQVKNQSELVRYALRQGIVPLDD